MKLRFMGVEISLSDEQAEAIASVFYRQMPSLLPGALDRLRRGGEVSIVGSSAWQATPPILIGHEGIEGMP
jgi:hypothetical protein